jgi:hypothetical protein
MDVILEKGASEKQVRKALRDMGYKAKEIGRTRKERGRRVLTVPRPVEAAIPLICLKPGVALVRCARGEKRSTYCPFLDD